MTNSNDAITFKVTLPDGRWTIVTAYTRSEARGAAKKDFELRRLPVGTVVKEYM